MAETAAGDELSSINVVLCACVSFVLSILSCGIEFCWLLIVVTFCLYVFTDITFLCCLVSVFNILLLLRDYYQNLSNSC